MMTPRTLSLAALAASLLIATVTQPVGAQVLSPTERVTAATPVPNGAISFPGALVLTAADEPAFRFDETTSFTIEAWLKLNSINTTTLIKKADSYSLRQVNDQLDFTTVINGSGSRDNLVTNFIAVPDEWFHITLVYEAPDGPGFGEKRIYINGVLDNSAPVAVLRSSTQPFQLEGPGGTHMDNVRVWNRVRTPAEIIADVDRDLNVFDPDTNTSDRPLPGLVAEWRFDQTTAGIARDSSGDSRNLTGPVTTSDLVDGLLFRPAAPLASHPSAALEFTGFGTKVIVPDNDLLDLSEAITIESWLYLDPLAAPRELAVVTKGASWGLVVNATSQLVFRTNDGTADDELVGATTLIPGRWYHVAATWDGTDKRICLDSLLDAESNWSGPLTTNATQLVMAAGSPGAIPTFDGRLDDVRIWSVAHSEAEIEALRWTQLRGFENGLRGYWEFDEASGTTVFDSSYIGNNGALSGSVNRVDGLAFAPLEAPIANSPSPDGGALYFPGDLAVKSSVVLPADPLLDPIESLTIEAWISVSSRTGLTQGIVTKGSTWGLLLDPAGHLVFRTRRGTMNANLTSTAPLALDKWHHVAAVFDGTNKHLIIDGALDSTASFTGTLHSDPFGRVAFSGNYDTTAGHFPFHGRMDMVRLWSSPRSQEALVAEQVRELRGTEPGLIGEWRFDGAAPANDSSRQRFHGLLGGSPAQFAPQPIDGLPFGLPPNGALALEFNWNAGSSDFANLTANANFDFTTQMTAEFWLHVDAIPAPGESFTLISKGASAWEVSLEDNGKINFHTAGVTLNDTLDEDNLPQPGTPFPTLLSTARIEPGEWYHVAVVWDGTGTNGRKEIHLNGQLDTNRDDYAAAIATNTSTVLLGARPVNDAGTSVANLLPGTLDEVRLWKVAVPGLQIRSAFDNELYGDELGLVGYWPFSQGGRNPDRTQALDVLDEGGIARTPIDGDFALFMGILNRVDGVLLGPPAEQQYSLSFNGVDEYLEVAGDPSLEIAGGSLTIEAWVNPLGDGFRNIVMQGDHGYGLAIDAQNRLRFFIDGNTLNAPASTETVTNEIWQHVAVVVDGVAGTTTFYINGTEVGVSQVANVTIKPGEPLFIGKQGPFGANYYEGLMDEVRVWFTARTPTEMNFFALQPLSSGDLPGLAAYWNFNEGRDPIAGNSVGGGPDGALTNMDDSNWRAGHFFPEGSIGEGLNLSPAPGSEGLWLGVIVLDSVNEVQTAIGGESNELSPTGDTLRVRVILHADANGALRLLKDVIIMGTPEDPTDENSPRRLVLVTDPLLIPQFEGIVERGGKTVGIRYGTVDYDFAGTELPMLGGITPGADAAGRITLGKSHPTNPFRHKYHPQHRNGFEITRQFALSFDTTAPDPATANPGFGTSWITGSYNETISGLHKIPLKTGGRFQLQRLNQVDTLNE